MTAILRQWLEKATLTTADLEGGTNGGMLSPAQAKQFIRQAIEASVLLPDARNESSDSPKFEVPRINLNSRVLRRGVQATRLDDADRVKPGTGLVELDTQLFKGEILVADEFFEDNVERESAAGTIMTMLAEAVGRDAEEIAIKSDTDRTGADDETLDAFDGIIATLQDELPANQILDVSAETTAQDIFRRMIEALPSRYRRNYGELRIYVPTFLRDTYHAELGERLTVLGDSAVVDNLATRLAYRGIPIEELPLLSGEDTINGASIDYATFAFLTHPKNIIAGWHRRIRIEKFRDPREGATSFLPSLRFDCKLGEPERAVLATGVPFEAPGS